MAEWEDISGATANTYEIETGDAGHELQCLVVATNAAGSSDPEPSNALGPVPADHEQPLSDNLEAADAHAAAVTKTRADAVEITDTVARTAEYARELAETPTVQDARAVTFTKALADTIEIADQATPTGWQDISGATADTYEIDDTDEGFELRCVVTASNSEGEASEPSNALGPVEAAPPGTDIDDSLEITDAVSFAVTKSIADSFEITDATGAGKSSYLTISDDLEISDLLDTGGSTALTHDQDDDLEIADTAAVAVTKAISDTVEIADTLARVAEFSRTIADEISVQDQATVGGVTNWVVDIDDTVTVADTPAKQAAITVADNLEAADATSKAPTVNLTETPTFQDEFARQWDAILALTETLEIADELEGGEVRFWTYDRDLNWTYTPVNG